VVRDTNVEVISMMLQALEKEHRWLFASLQGPIIAFVMDLLPVSFGGGVQGRGARGGGGGGGG
jgi:hypothetical protein